MSRTITQTPAANDIKSRIKSYIVDYFEGFEEFNFADNIVDMGITDNDFVFSLIRFIENEFCVTIFKHELYKMFTINSIAKLITSKMKSSQKIITRLRARQSFLCPYLNSLYLYVILKKVNNHEYETIFCRRI